MVVQASEARAAWRTRQGAASITLDECEVRVADPRAPNPRVTLERLQTGTSAARTLVSEMMIMAGQVAATVGEFLLSEHSEPSCPNCSDAHM